MKVMGYSKIETNYEMSIYEFTLQTHLKRCELHMSIKKQ